MSEPYQINMPQLSDTMEEGVLVSWEKSIGDRIERGDIVATIETDKAIMDVEVFREGFLSGPLAAVGAVVPVGDPIAWLVAEASEVSSEAAAAPEVAPAEEANAAPAAGPVPGQGTDGQERVAGDVRGGGRQAADGAPEGATHTIGMPQLSDTMEEGVVVSWEKEVGDRIERGDVVATVETDKAIMDLEVFREGILSGPLAPIGSVIAVGAPMAYLVGEADQVVHGEAAQGEAAPATMASEVTAAPFSASPGPAPVPTHPAAEASDAEPAPRPAGRAVTPRARRLAAERGVDLAKVSGTGPSGEITANDVAGAAAPAAPAAPWQQAIQVPGEGRAMTSLERAVSHNMVQSLTMPTFRVTVHARPEALARAARASGASVTVAIARACAIAMKDNPRMNWAYQPEDRLVERDQVDVGMAVTGDDGGLVVPVLRRVESRSLEEIGAEWKDLVQRARKRRLRPEEYADPTFMISNMGMLGVSFFDAIPTPGIAAILAIGTAGADGMPLTITADHRVVYGAHVASYLNTLKRLIEHPETWMDTGPAIPEGEWDCDVAVIGGGPGGEDCARELAGRGLRVALINDMALPGGECLWRGCIPSKTWRAAADRLRDRATDAHLGIEGTTGGTLDWDALEKTRRHVLETRGELARKTDQGVRIRLVQGHARFTDEHTLAIETAGNQSDPYVRTELGKKGEPETLTFGCAVIATGAPPFVPPIEGAREGLEAGGVLTSDTIWSALDGVPKRLAVVGGGAIGLEMAQIFHDFGTEVTLLEAQDRILAEVEAEIARALTQVLSEESRLSVHTSARVESISGVPGDMRLAWNDSDGGSHEVRADYVLMATGKRPMLDGLGLDAAGVEVGKDGAIPVDASCRTSAPHIFAVGDVVGGLMLAHTASQQGRVAAKTIAGERARYDQARDCGVIFTRPQAAFVGLSVAQAKEVGIDAVEVKMPISIDAMAMINNEVHGLIKIVADQRSHRIIGVHLLADRADTLIGEGVMMVAGNMTLEQVADAIHPHPTQTELFGEMARRLLSRLRRTQRSTAGAAAPAAPAVRG